jgi:hypothetical protein
MTGLFERVIAPSEIAAVGIHVRPNLNVPVFLGFVSPPPDDR